MLVLMISDEEIQNLPADPKLAFSEYVRLLRMVVARDVEPQGTKIERSFVANIRAFTDVSDIGLEILPAPLSTEDFWEYYNELNEKLDYLVAKFRLEGLRGGYSMGYGQIELTDDYRTQIHQYLAKVRKIVGAIEIEERLRENILKRLNALVIEVDKSRSGLIRFADALIEITAAVGESAEKLEPAVKIMERIGGIFGKARKEGDVKQISGGEEPKLITGPVKNANTGDTTEATDPDDEIPF